MRTRIKTCGITRIQDVQEAARQGADAIGLIFYPPSPRYLSLDQARAIVSCSPAFMSTVAVFVNPDRAEVEEVIRRCGVSLLQFHGDEPADFCASFDRPYIKAARIRPGMDLLKYLSPYESAQAWMLDAYHDDLWGGTGGAFDWNLVPANPARPIILSGGLTADNVAEAIRRVRPYALDVSTGVEAAKGIKDAAKMAAFFAGVRSADL
jgi:phosphoribosylanthranilate isomerase